MKDDRLKRPSVVPSRDVEMTSEEVIRLRRQREEPKTYAQFRELPSHPQPRLPQPSPRPQRPPVRPARDETPSQTAAPTPEPPQGTPAWHEWLKQQVWQGNWTQAQAARQQASAAAAIARQQAAQAHVAAYSAQHAGQSSVSHQPSSSASIYSYSADVSPTPYDFDAHHASQEKLVFFMGFICGVLVTSVAYTMFSGPHY